MKFMTNFFFFTIQYESATRTKARALLKKKFLVKITQTQRLSFVRQHLYRQQLVKGKADEQ